MTESPHEQTRPALADIVILDVSRVLAGPYCTMVLADYGARVLKIEQPERGDDTRRWGPPFSADGESAYFQSANRNKESLTLNLKHDRGVEIFRRLVQQADVLIENFRAGAMDGLGLGYAECARLNPGLIYCAITGYGQTGPYRDRPGYDNIIEAQGGIMSITGEADGEPSKVGVAIADITAGLHAAIAILTALHERQRSGHGQYIDVSLFDVQLSWLANVASSYLVSGKAPQRYGNAHPSIVPYQTFATADGMIMVAVGNDSQFQKLCRVLNMESLSVAEEYSTNVARVANRETLIGKLAPVFAARKAQEWVTMLLAAEIPCGPVNDIPTALADPQAVARDMVQEISREDGSRVRQVGPPVKLSRTPAQIHRAPPRLGEHTQAVLAERLGLDTETIESLRNDGVI